MRIMENLDVYDSHYKTVRNLILHGIMHEQLRYSIKQSVTIVMRDAVFRSNSNYATNATAYNEAVINVSKNHMEDMILDATESILDAIGNGSLKKGIFALINVAAITGWKATNQLPVDSP
jgi:hypothetical protein